MSVDLAGSTAYKNGAGKQWESESTVEQNWVVATRDFYTKFPNILNNHYRDCQKQFKLDKTLCMAPTVWKTVGDEIIFYVRACSKKHVAACIDAFLRAQKEYGTHHLDRMQGRPLDIKGSAWIAAFPAHNVTVAIKQEKLKSEQISEQFEAGADQSPDGIDFLGHSIDCGFRISSCAANDRFCLSVELAWILADAADRNWFPHRFNYHQRRILKGVLRDRPYPLVSIETERNHSRRIVRDRERRIEGAAAFEPWELRDFLRSFMDDEQIEFPDLPQDDEVHDPQPPSSYTAFVARWRAEAEAEARRQDDETTSESPGVDEVEGDGIPPDLLQAAQETIAAAQREAEATGE